MGSKTMGSVGRIRQEEESKVKVMEDIAQIWPSMLKNAK